METTARVPGNSASGAREPRVGEHIHQLLNLASAIIKAATISAPDPDADADDTSTSGGRGGDRHLPSPFGLNVGSLSDTECVQWARDLERLGRFQQALTVQVTGELAERVAADRFSQSGFHSPVALLVQSVRVSAVEARRRIRLSETLLPLRDNLTGVVTPALQPVVGKAFFKAELSADHALMIANFVEEAQGLAKAGLITDERSLEVQSSLVATGREADPDFLRHAGNRIMAHLDPDGQKPTEGDLISKQGLFFRSPRRGLIHFDGHLSIEQYEHLMAAIGTATNPNKHGIINPTDERNHESLQADDPDAGQDAVYEQLSGIMAFFESAPQPSTSPSPSPSGQHGVPNEPQESTGQQKPPERSQSTAPSNETAPETDRQDPSAENDSGYESGGLGDVDHEEDPWIVDGVQVPHPGTWEELEGLDPIDPESSDPAVKDHRTRAQKLLDGLIDCVKLAARSGKLPLNGGLKTQLIITTSEEDINRRDGTGTAFTPYSGPVPLHLFEQSLCDPDVTHLYLGEGQNILNVGRTQRLFTSAQRKILFARDLGCSFPDCTIPAHWTEAHHIIPWQNGGETNIDNAALLCSYHHALLHRSAWTVTLKNGTPYFTAPYLIDPSQTPRRNNFHHGLIPTQSMNGPKSQTATAPSSRNSSENTVNAPIPDAAKAPSNGSGPSPKQKQEQTQKRTSDVSG
ncbi:HNH endonuclease signature motif containing protein [Arthrobacter sp. TMN-49]